MTDQASSFSVGCAGSAKLGRRGARLDLFGGPSVLSWGIAFGHVAAALLLGALAFIRLIFPAS